MQQPDYDLKTEYYKRNIYLQVINNMLNELKTTVLHLYGYGSIEIYFYHQ